MKIIWANLRKDIPAEYKFVSKISRAKLANDFPGLYKAYNYSGLYTDFEYASEFPCVIYYCWDWDNLTEGVSDNLFVAFTKHEHMSEFLMKYV